MRTISPILKGKKEQFKTSGLYDILDFLTNQNPPMTEIDAADYNMTQPFLISDDGNYVAAKSGSVEKHSNLSGIGLYRVIKGIPSMLTHITYEEFLREKVTFTLEKETEYNILEITHPKGDIILKMKNGNCLLCPNPVVDLADTYDLWNDIDEIIYTGISKNNTENVLIDFSDYLE